MACYLQMGRWRTSRRADRGLPLTGDDAGREEVCAGHSRRDAEGGVFGRIRSVPESARESNRYLAESHCRDRQQSTADHGGHRTTAGLVLWQQSGVLDESSNLLRPQNGTTESEPRRRETHQDATCRMTDTSQLRT